MRPARIQPVDVICCLPTRLYAYAMIGVGYRLGQLRPSRLNKELANL
jgi:hypothetical protein